MTTRAQARAELVAAFTAASVQASETPGGDPPYVLVAGGGLDPEHVMRQQVLGTFRCILVAGAWDDVQAAASLDALVSATSTVLSDLPGWQLGTLGQDGYRDFSGSLFLTAEWSASRMIDIP